MKNLQTGTTCLSSSTGSKQHKCRRSLQRLATFVILFLCSMTVSWAQETTTTDGNKTFNVEITKTTGYIFKSEDGFITATFSNNDGLEKRDNCFKFRSNKNGTLTINADGATISNISLFASSETSKPDKGIDISKEDKSVTVSNVSMPVVWDTNNKSVTLKCGSTGIYVFGAIITYQYDDADKLSLNVVSAPTITPNDDETSTSKLSFIITQTANTQDGTALETYYTTDGSIPNTENATKLTGSSQTVTIDWNKGDKVTVRTITKRVDNNDATNYRYSGVVSKEFSNTGSDELASVDAPVITPDGEAIVASNLEVTIKDSQWTTDLSSKLKVKYATEVRNNDGTVTSSTWTVAESLPVKLNLTKTSTVKAYAEFTASDGKTTSSDIVSRTYFLLDDATTYLNTATPQNVGTTVERNGMTMTFGGIKVGSSNFKALSKNDNTDANTLGSIHTVSGNALFVNVDVESELGDGKIGGENKSHEYLHCNASTKKLHENTFALPAVGSFFKFEPEANGKLTVFVEQQGAIHNVSRKLISDVVRKRPVYFLDETGKSIPANYAYTSSKVNKADWTEIQKTNNKDGDTFYTKEYMDNLQKYYQDIIDGNNKSFTNFNSAVADADKRKALTLGTSIQPIIVLHEACNADILKGDGMSETGDDNYDGTGYMLISEGYVTYEFPVQAGKTYYLFASRTKLALSGFCFDKDPSYAATDVTLEGDKDNATTIEGLTVGKQYNVTLNRKFGANKWYSVVLPIAIQRKPEADEERVR